MDVVRRVVILTLVGLVVGVVAATVAVGFVEAVFWLNDFFWISPRSRVLIDNQQWLIAATILVPAVGGLLVGILVHWIPEKRPHGPPDAIRAAQSLNPAMPARGSILTMAAATIGLGTGASVGQYGPLAHMGASLGAWISRIGNAGRYVGTIGIGCGAAAAISAAFNAPIAGLVFAHEVILRHYSLRAFAPISVAATIGYVMANIVFERPPLFRVETMHVENAHEYALFIGTGIAGAIIAMLFMRAVIFSASMAKKLKIPAIFKPAVAGLCLGVVALQLPDVLGIGQEALRFAIIEGAFTAPELAITLIAKLLLTAMCIGFGFAGGVFSPALLIGILFGALTGISAEWIFGEDHSNIAIYAVCGMVAVTSPVIGAPLTTILIVFELTRNYDLATAAMVSVAFANLIGYRIFGRSLFDAQLAGRGFDLSMGRDKVIVQQQSVRFLLDEHVTKVQAYATLEEVRKAMLDDHATEAYVIEGRRDYLGTIPIARLLELMDAGVASTETADRYAEPDWLVLAPDDSIWRAMDKMHDFVGDTIPVVEEGKLLGVVHSGAIVNAYTDILNDIRREENAAA